MKSSGQPLSDQEEIWDDVAKYSNHFGVDSETCAMSDIYDEKKDDLDDISDHFAHVEGQKGGLFQVNGKIVGLEIFDSSLTFKKLYRKILLSYAMDAMTLTPNENKPKGKRAITNFIKSIQAASIESYPASTGIGEDVRISGRNITGGALVLNGRIVHMFASKSS